MVYVVTEFTGPVCVPVPCTVGWSVSMLSLCLQDQYVFLYHALLDGLQTGHLAYPVSQYTHVYTTLSIDDEHMGDLKKQFQVICLHK